MDGAMIPFDLPTRRLVLAVGAALLAAPALAAERLPATVLAPEDRALVDRAVAYLQGLTTARGRFIQTDARGQVTQGEVFMQRPGRARFAYDPPSGLLVVSNGSTVSMYDRRLRTFQSYPLGATALSLFLAREISLSRGVIVEQVVRTAGGFDIVARDAHRQAEGRIRLSFSNAPALTGWTLTDAQGQPTRVQLVGFGPSGPLSGDLFVLRDPRPHPGGPHG
jgi:outer membrane lipoprotein-sorting protein